MTTEKPNVTLTGLYPISVAARHLGVQRSTVYNWIKAGVFMRREMPKKAYGRKETRLTGAAILRIWRS